MDLDGEWLATTPSGLFDGSPGGWRRITWREGDKDVSVAAKRLLSLNEFVLKARAARLEAESQLVAIQSAISTHV